MKKDENRNDDIENEVKEEFLNEDENELQDDEQADEEALRIQELENEVAGLKDKYLRTVAEFQNYKRRTENDQLNLFKYAAESFIKNLLPVVDDFERSLLHMDKTGDNDSIKQGIRMVYDKLMKVLEEQGVKKIDAVGQPFDVNYHEAIMQRKEEDKEPHVVLDELEKGYMYKDRVIRHSKVIVNEES